MTSSVNPKALGDCLLGLGRGQSPKYVEGESPVRAINQKCIRNGTVDVTYSRAHEPLGFVKEFALLRDGDVCINSTGTGTIGRVGLWAPFPSEMDRFFADSHVTIIRPNTKVVNSAYLAAVLQSPAVQTALETYCFSGSTNQVELNKNALSDLKLSLLSRDEQEIVAEVIASIDRVVQKNEALIVKLQRIKIGLMQDVLTRGIDEHGNIRSEATHAFKDSPLGRIPVEWSYSTFGELWAGGAQNGIYKPQSAYSESGTPIMRIDSFRNGDLINCQEFRRVELTRAEIKSFALKTGDIVVNRVNSIEWLGKTALVGDLREATVFESNMMRICIDHEQLIPEFAILILSSSRVYRHYLRCAKTAVAQASINQEDVRSIPIACPPPTEQAELVKRVATLRDLIDGVSLAAQKIVLLRAGLMRDLLTGERHLTSLLAQVAAQ